MRKTLLGLSLAILIIISAWPAAGLGMQQDPQAQSGSGGTYGSKFFDELHNIFGKFRNEDLQRVFQEAQPIECSELVGHKGQWRSVAFFNEDRRLGEWCRESLDEVRSDLAVYTFTGTCRGDQGTIQVASEFPTAASVEAYNQRQIDLNQIDITVNDPVSASLNSRTMAYTFDLPYLFLTGQRGQQKLYSFVAPDRDAAYATDVTSHWECKAVATKDVTYRFLICRTATVPRGRPPRNQRWEPSFGASAYFILSDGTEAHTSVNLTFGDGASSSEKPSEAAPGPLGPARPTLKRQVPPKPPGS